ncbi:MAG: hypothetical protein IKH51_09015 [Clostridia bacterium]|nr:hypothetical protein [Bacteroidales bacterium]MBR6922323.1 hypothetical protein [Clostridia bacterium]
MDKARIFNENTNIIVSAEEVKRGDYSCKDYEFVDVEYEFKVKFVKGAKNHGRPYFRLYYSYEDYKKLYPDRADRYAIVANMRKYQESIWHKKWKNNFSSFCEIEKCIKNECTGMWKFADAYYEKYKTCIEIQHSYIAHDFEERNSFYSQLGINVIWLYDLPKAAIKENENGDIEILEDNARGFFRISENPNNLLEHPVFIQVKSGMIFRVTELFRNETTSELKSSIRYFKPAQIYTEEDFVDAIRQNKLGLNNGDSTLYTLNELWNQDYKWMIVEDTEDENNTKMINRDNDGDMFRSFENATIQFKYVTCFKHNSETKYIINSNKDYSISHKKANKRIWKLVCKKLITEK